MNPKIDLLFGIAVFICGAGLITTAIINGGFHSRIMCAFIFFGTVILLASCVKEYKADRMDEKKRNIYRNQTTKTQTR